MIVMLLGFGLLTAQDEEGTKKRKDRPVTEMFGSSLLIDNQTSVIPGKKTIEMQIMHRFGLIKDNGISDLFGIYAPSANTRMGLNYSILDNLMVGYGITRKNMYSDFQVKWAIIRQTRQDVVPLTVAVYANMAIDGRNKDVFGEDYDFANRLSYFSQVIVGRKFTDWLSVELNASFTHYNATEAGIANFDGYDHDVFGWGGNLRFKFSTQSSIIITYSAPIYIGSITDNQVTQNKFYSNFAVGYEVRTATHSFQIFAGTANGIIPQDIYMYNTSNWTKGEFRFGFNITRLWEF
jgi:hypothetical protein